MSTKGNVSVEWGDKEPASDPVYELVISAPLSVWEATVRDLSNGDEQVNYDLYYLLKEKFPQLNRVS